MTCIIKTLRPSLGREFQWPSRPWLFVAVGSWVLAVATLPAQTAQVFAVQARLNPSQQVVLQWAPDPGSQGYRVEYRDAVNGGAWLPCPAQDQWPQAETTWTDLRPLAAAPRLYRVLSLNTLRGTVLTQTLVRAYTSNELSSLTLSYGLLPRNAVNFHRVTYATLTADGASTHASGALLVPVNPAAAPPLLSYQHGTLTLSNAAPSQAIELHGIALAFAALGYVVALPDYLGLGSSRGPHPYLHARSEATASVDMLRASRTLCAQFGVALNGQLFALGYSQGGQATMALHREIETHHTNEFTLTASAPLAGPYDLSTTGPNIILSDAPYGEPHYVPYVLLGMNAVYRLFEAPAEAFAEPYATTLPPLYDGSHSKDEINAAMPTVPGWVLRPDYRQAFASDPAHPLRLALQRNDTYDWAPVAPMRLYHCAADDLVSFSNAVTATNRFHTLGATQVQLVDPAPAADHAGGFLPCAVAAGAWFESLRQ